MKRYLVRNKIEVMYILLHAILYGLFLAFDVSGYHTVWSNRIKFSIILLCFCYALISCMGRNVLCNQQAYNKSIFIFMQAGLLFTVISDLFLLILDRYIYGVLTFIIVQQLYALRIIRTDGRNGFLKRYFIRVSLQLVAAFFVCLLLRLSGISLEALLVISAFYFICIATNTITAVLAAFRNPLWKGNLLFAVGMVLFLMCDINVGIFNMSGFIAMPEQLYQLLYSVSSILMWTFYAPSQVLISLSVSRSCKK